MEIIIDREASSTDKSTPKRKICQKSKGRQQEPQDNAAVVHDVSKAESARNMLSAVASLPLPCSFPTQPDPRYKATSFASLNPIAVSVIQKPFYSVQQIEQNSGCGLFQRECGFGFVFHPSSAPSSCRCRSLPRGYGPLRDSKVCEGASQAQRPHLPGPLVAHVRGSSGSVTVLGSARVSHTLPRYPPALPPSQGCLACSGDGRASGKFPAS